MLSCKSKCRPETSAIFPEFKPFSLKDQNLVQTYVDRFAPESCEYNFANLFAWQKAYDLSFSLYQDRLLIHDGLSRCFFMPLGEDLTPDEMVFLSIQLKRMGYEPTFGLFTPEYMDRHPMIGQYFKISQERDYAEYIYEVDHLCDLTGDKLHKKKNLISQFNRSYPEHRVQRITDELKSECLKFAQELLSGPKVSEDLILEFSAIETSFRHFERLGLDGLAVTVDGRIAAFSVFSPLNPSTYDIQFEKSSSEFKGAAQVINHETAKYLRDTCRFVNREQDLGIEGLRQAKMSYDPVRLVTPVSLTLMMPN